MASGNGIDVEVKPQDIQEVIKNNALFAVQLENASLRRTLEELTVQIAELKNGASGKEE
jgi:regulator of replication initiation timing